MIILGIETSCDETGAAVIQTTSQTLPVLLLSNVVASSLSLHAQTGGIIPEIAAREQVKYILPVIEKALHEAKKNMDDIDALAVTYGPGLIGSLLVGVETVKTLSYIYDKPIIPVNHMYGHIYANWILTEKDQTTNKQLSLTFPALALVVSGGHTDLVLMKNHGDVEVIGQTRDDAAGEAFDKIGRLVGLPYPAGPLISQLAKKGNAKAYDLPRPMIGSKDFDFSFSGLKTAVLTLSKTNPEVKDLLTTIAKTPSLAELSSADKQQLADICASVEEAIVASIVSKTIKAAKEYKVTSLILGGGVAANTKLQKTLENRITALHLPVKLSIPETSLCTDNGAMIAAAAFYQNQDVSWKNVTVNPELYY